MPSAVNTTIPDIFLANDWPTVVELFKVVNGTKVGMSDLDGAAVGYLAMADDASNAIDADLNLTVTYIPDEDPTIPAGKWQVELQASNAVDVALTPYIGQNLFAIVKHPAGARAVAKVKVNKTRYFTVK